MPGRVQPPNGDNAQEFWAYNYNTAIYSDDRGKTWQVAEPVQSGTGEGTLAELTDGRIYYNSRCHMAVDARRLVAWSHDGGHRWVDWQVCDTLREVGEPFYYKYGSKPSYGCNAGLVRVPLEATNGRDVLLYCAPDNPGGTRVRMTGQLRPCGHLVDQAPCVRGTQRLFVPDGGQTGKCFPDLRTRPQRQPQTRHRPPQDHPGPVQPGLGTRGVSASRCFGRTRPECCSTGRNSDD